MIIYTEKQLKEAWHIHCAELVYSNSDSKFKIELPTLEQFRPIYEDQMEDLYHGDTS
tara:strand:+ start:661 stop:831 length:171 start_codon:yes stop_codon:yes gene_type:complete